MTRFLHRNDEGYTLIELLIVIAIIAILVSIVSINVTGIMDQVNDVAIDAELQTVQLAVDRYNTWDVGVSGFTVITGNSPASKISISGGPVFAKYLSGQTKYCYTWGADGADLVNQICTTTP
jgi:prepilin-type N-terminal cleavage/methylation domain-containing protein